MAFVFQRRLAIPTTLFAVAAVAIAAMMRSIPWLRTSRVPVGVLPSRHREQPSAAIIVAAGARVRTLAEPNRSAAEDDALDLVRMDDDGGWQMPQRPA